MATYHSFNFLHNLLYDVETLAIARLQPKYFISDSKLGLSSLLKYLLCRTGKTTTNEIMSYFSAYDALENSVSKQAIFQAQEKLNPLVFHYINEKLLRYYYQQDIDIDLRGYTVIAIDGSVILNLVWRHLVRVDKKRLSKGSHYLVFPAFMMY